MSVIVCKLSNILRPHPIFSPAYQKAGEKIYLPLLGKATQSGAPDEKAGSKCASILLRAEPFRYAKRIGPYGWFSII